MGLNTRPWPKNGWSENDSSFGTVHRKEIDPIIIDVREDILLVAVLADGKHVVSGGAQGKIRRWRIEDGKEVGTAMVAGSTIYGIAVSRDGKVIATGTEDGRVAVWNAESHSKVTDFKAHGNLDRVCAVDVSPDATKIATGSGDNIACVWSLSTGERLLGPLEHDCWVEGVKFSPDGRLLATATCKSVRVYDSQKGCLLVKLAVKVESQLDHSLAWASDSKQLFALSHDGHIHRVDVSTRITVSKWLIDGSDNATCIALASNETFIVASAGSSVSFWDATSQEQIGTVINHTHNIESMAMSSNYDLVTGGDKRITLRTLCGILPSRYLDNTSRVLEIQKTEVDEVDDSPDKRMLNFVQTIPELRNRLATHEQKKNSPIQPLRAREESLNSKNALQKSVHEPRDKLPESRLAANQEREPFNETTNFLRANLCAREESSSGRITDLEQTIQELRVQLANAQRINYAHEQKHRCEYLYAQGRIHGAAECLLELANTVDEDVRLGANKVITDFVAGFIPRCVTALERVGDEALNTGNQDEASTAYSAALLLGPTTPNAVLTKWASTMLSRGSADEASRAAAKFKVPRFAVYRVICDGLLGGGDGRLTEALKCFQQMQNELPGDEGVRDERAEWELDFRGRCAEKLLVEKLREISRDSEKHNMADALSLNPTKSKRSKEDVEPEPCRKKGRWSTS